MMPKPPNMEALWNQGPSLFFTCNRHEKEFAIQLTRVYKTLYLLHLLFDPNATTPYSTMEGLNNHELRTRY